DHSLLPPFPTRRSSDLTMGTQCSRSVVTRREVGERFPVVVDGAANLGAGPLHALAPVADNLGAAVSAKVHEMDVRPAQSQRHVEGLTPIEGHAEHVV